MAAPLYPVTFNVHPGTVAGPGKAQAARIA
jgi:hypothetical protein